MQGYRRDPGVSKLTAKKFGTIKGFGNKTGDYFWMIQARICCFGGRYGI